MPDGTEQCSRTWKGWKPYENGIHIRSRGGLFDLWQFAVTLLAIAAALVVALLLRPTAGIENVDLVFLTAIVAIAIRYGPWLSLLACVLSMLAYNFFFFPPFYTFHVADPTNVAALFFFLVVAGITSHLASRVRAARLAAERRAKTTEALYTFSRKIAGIVSLDDLLWAIGHQIALMLRLDVMILLPGVDGELRIQAGYPPNDQIDTADLAVAHRAWNGNCPAGWGTDNPLGAQRLFLPLHTSRGSVGVIGVSRATAGDLITSEEQRLLTALIDQAAIAIERVRLAREMDEARLAAETERLRSALLTSLSHDLKTPLASITGAVTSLRQYGDLYDAAARDELAATIQDEADRLSRFVINLLDMTRLEAGGIELKREAVDLGEIVGTALQRAKSVLVGHRVSVELPAELPMLTLDVVLIEQVLVNLLDNAAKYSPTGSKIVISARCERQAVALSVSDEGSGIPAGDLERVFEMFYRVNKTDQQRAGTGLGLSICRGFVSALGGTIQAANRTDAPGAVFTITLPEATFTTALRAEAAE